LFKKSKQATKDQDKYRNNIGQKKRIISENDQSILRPDQAILKFDQILFYHFMINNILLKYH
jgi:hypothetical protein